MPPYVWTPPICLDVPLDATYIWQQPNIQWGSQTYGGHPNVWCSYGHPLSLTKHAFFCVVDVQGHPHVWGIWTPLHLTKHAFFVLCMYRGIQTSFKYMGASKHMGVVQAYKGASKHRGHPIIQGHPNIWGHPNIEGDIQTWGYPKCMGHMDTP